MKKDIKVFVLDTNVLLANPYSFMSFGTNIVVIPDTVLKELDKFKTNSYEIGAHSRQVARMIDKLMGQGKLYNGVKLPNGGILKIEPDHIEEKLPDSWEIDNDARIIRTALHLQKENDVYFLSKDVYARIRAEGAGLRKVQDYYADNIAEESEEYNGRSEVYTESKNFEELKLGGLEKEKVFKCSEKTGKKLKKIKLETNEFLIVRSIDNPDKQTMLARFDGEKIVPLDYVDNNIHPFGVKPRSVGQRFIQEALLQPAENIPLVILKGPAGTAKTFYSLACGLHQTWKTNKRYRKILVCRPTVKLDEDIGFLPGTEQSKIAPFMRSVMDNLEQLVDKNDEERYSDEVLLKDKIDELFDRGIISTEAIAFMRGRNIVQQWLIIDEAQNLTPKQATAIITRAGQGTKVILIGDPNQIDHPFLDSKNNGLSFAADRMKGSKLCAQLTLTSEDCQRSKLAMESAKRMK
jgi:PhoH-like ATPase